MLIKLNAVLCRVAKEWLIRCRSREILSAKLAVLFWISSRRRFRLLALIGFALACAVPFGLAVANGFRGSAHLAIVAYVPAMYVIRRLHQFGEVGLFALLTSAFSLAAVTFWLPVAIADMAETNLVVGGLLAGALWSFWSGASAVFLIVFRYCHTRYVLLTACLGVMLTHYWPSVFGANLLSGLMHAEAFSGSAFFIGTAGLEVVSIMLCAFFVQAIYSASVGPLCRALMLLVVVLGLDAASAHYTSSTTGRSLNVAMVQAGNVYAQKLSSADDIKAFVHQVVNEAQPRPDLVVFPESVFSFNVADDPLSANAAITLLQRVSEEQDVAFLLSTVQGLAQEASTNEAIQSTRISALLISQGEIQGRADKSRTIPFAEYTPAWAVPIYRWLGARLETRIPSYEYQEGIVKGVRIVPLNCFESIDQAVVEERLGVRPGLLVSQSNLSSFGDPGFSTYRGALWGHMERELRSTNEWQVPVVRAVKNGGSTVINGNGRVDLDLLEQSWGQEWVAARVAIPGFSVFNESAAWLRQLLGGLILALAFGGLARCLALWLRPRISRGGAADAR